jgi:hypothetical protein
MPPTLFVEFGLEAGRHSRRGVVIRRVASRAGRAGSSAATSAIAVQRPFGMAFAYPAAIFAQIVFYQANISVPAPVNFTKVPDSCR